MPVNLEIAIRLLLAAVLGAIIGFQREKAGKEAGLRTHILISSGAALFTLVSTYGFANGDPSRIAAGVVTGIGFIGAGVILHRSGGAVIGLTTAATIWLSSGIGLAAGAGMYLLSVMATALTVIALLLPHLNKIQKR